ncbi:hypothetical protein DWUX_444 [Desulfovibrio diazotrophicus]|nr:hypothetical protein DWUX_444 [Desulfovibrio diazotrophicus]
MRRRPVRPHREKPAFISCPSFLFVAILPSPLCQSAASARAE